jgi:ABC-type phosphate/phosphonate transport system ATPase subunit
MHNPYSTKFWTPGVLPFQFSEHDETIDSLQEKSHRLPICQIAGPHGSGKSTLLLELLKRYEQSGGNVRSLFFNDQHRHISGDVTFQKDQIVFADGFEQLSYASRLRLLFRSKRLIVTVHRPLWFMPVLYRTKPQFSIFVQIVRSMTPNVPEESALQAVYERSGGNYRNAFFELYDLWETTHRHFCDGGEEGQMTFQFSCNPQKAV